VTRQNLDSTFSVVKVQLLRLSFATSQGLQLFEASGLRQTLGGDKQNGLGHRPKPPDRLGYMPLATLSWHSAYHICPSTDKSILYLVTFVKWPVSLISKSALSPKMHRRCYQSLASRCRLGHPLTNKGDFAVIPSLDGFCNH